MVHCTAFGGGIFADTKAFAIDLVVTDLDHGLFTYQQHYLKNNKPSRASSDIDFNTCLEFIQSSCDSEL